jgi:hypothetical protein
LQSAKDVYYAKKHAGRYMEDQQHMEGHPHWPRVEAGLTRVEQLLTELEVAMEEVLYLRVQPIPGLTLHRRMP